jgi:polyphosphate kinase
MTSSPLFAAADFYINRELSWLSFDERVLEEAEDPNNPLLERLKFAAIVAANLDEFFMVRVASLIDQVSLGYNEPENKTGMTPVEMLRALSSTTHSMVSRLYTIINEAILPELEKAGVIFLEPEHLSHDQKQFLERFFFEQVYPVLTPMAVDASRPFPMLLNKSLNLAVMLHDREAPDDPEPLFAFVQIPAILPRAIALGDNHYILLEDVVALHLQALFRGNKILSACTFRITRNADLDVDEEGAEDLLKAIEIELKNRNMGQAVRLELESDAHPFIKQNLLESLELHENEVYPITGPIDPTYFFGFYNQTLDSSLRFETIKPTIPHELHPDVNIFTAIAKKDIVLHHPYQSFEPVVRFFQAAAVDPDVLAIKQTLYRVSGDSPIVAALALAAENGKQVTVLVELKARFDEARNIVWAKKLEQAGCHVIYGLVGLQTHSKVALVVRRQYQTLCSLGNR